MTFCSHHFFQPLTSPFGAAWKIGQAGAGEKKTQGWHQFAKSRLVNDKF